MRISGYTARRFSYITGHRMEHVEYTLEPWKHGLLRIKQHFGSGTFNIAASGDRKQVKEHFLALIRIKRGET